MSVAILLGDSAAWGVRMNNPLHMDTEVVSTDVRFCVGEHGEAAMSAVVCHDDSDHDAAIMVKQFTSNAPLCRAPSIVKAGLGAIIESLCRKLQCETASREFGLVLTPHYFAMADDVHRILRQIVRPWFVEATILPLPIATALGWEELHRDADASIIDGIDHLIIVNALESYIYCYVVRREKVDGSSVMFEFNDCWAGEELGKPGLFADPAAFAQQWEEFWNDHVAASEVDAERSYVLFLGPEERRSRFESDALRWCLGMRHSTFYSVEEVLSLMTRMIARDMTAGDASLASKSMTFSVRPGLLLGSGPLAEPMRVNEVVGAGDTVKRAMRAFQVDSDSPIALSLRSGFRGDPIRSQILAMLPCNRQNRNAKHIAAAEYDGEWQLRILGDRFVAGAEN